MQTVKKYKLHRFVQRVLLNVSGQRFYRNALLSAPLPCLVLCVAVPLGRTVRLHDIFIRRATVTPQPDGMVSARWALTLSLAILSQKGCQGECALKLSSFSHPPVIPLHHTTPVFSVRSISGHTILCSPKPLSFSVFLLLTVIMAVLHLQHNLNCCACKAALLRLYSFESSADAPDVYLADRAGHSWTVCYLICPWHCVICQL